MSEATYRLGTRGSFLARTQAGLINNEVARISGHPASEVVVRTDGDDVTISLTTPGRPGIFVTALRAALRTNRVDLVVHSYKDLPSLPEPDLIIAAIPVREDPRDVLISRDGNSLSDLPAGSRVGTSSPRRMARIKYLRPDLFLFPIRGNIDTRLRKLEAGEYDAIILAAAGVHRIGRQDEIVEYLSTEQLLPAPAQGALAVECRRSAQPLIDVLNQIDDAHTRLTVVAERAVLVGLSATCATAIGALATIADDSTLLLSTELSDPATGETERVDTSIAISGLADLDAAHRLGLLAAAELSASKLGKRLGSGWGHG